MEKHTPYFKALETIQKNNTCALCFLEKEAVHSHFEAFLYENVNDPVARKALRESFGYCAYHTHYLIGFRDPLAFSILYKDQAIFAASFLEKFGTHKHLLGEWLQHERCPACDQALTIRRHYVGIVAQGLKETEMRSAFMDHFHVCFAHLLMVMDQIQDGSFKKELSEKMGSRLMALAADQEQYCQDSQKNASGLRFDSPFSESWKQAVEILCGQKEVFEAFLGEI